MLSSNRRFDWVFVVKIKKIVRFIIFNGYGFNKVRRGLSVCEPVASIALFSGPIEFSDKMKIQHKAKDS